jgi:lysophospholipase L1-like esterase
VGVAIVILLTLEGGARIIWESKYHELLEAMLHDYERVDYERNLVVPTPGSRVSVEEFYADLRRRGRHAGLEHLEKLRRNYSLTDTTVLISINQHGFRGPDVDVPKPNDVFRILTIGDSCTWGLMVGDRQPYPRVLEQALNDALGHTGEVSFEVVNGGFCADGLQRSLARIDQFVSVEPDLITIYLGWNRTIFRADPRRLRLLYELSALYRFYYHCVVSPPGWLDGSSEERVRFYDPGDPSLEPFREYGFEHDICDLDRLVEALHSLRPSAAIVLITLPGLLDCEVQPDDHAIDKSSPLEQSDNVYLYPLLAKRWNEAIRSYAGTHGLDVIDLEQYARESIDRRSNYFMDAVHWNAEGYREVGRFLAAELAKYAPVEWMGHN